MDFQLFLERRIGVGRSQYLTLLALALVEMADGMQAITGMFNKYSVSLITPIIKKELFLDEGELSFLASVFYIGVAVGAMIAGFQAKAHGRKMAIIVGVCTQIISALFLAIKSSYLWFCFFRFLYGFGFGSTLAVATLIATEFMPLKQRGRTLLIISFMSSIGKLIGVGLAFVFLNGKDDDWPMYMLTSTSLSFVALALILLYVKESFRYLFSKRKINEGIEVLNIMIKLNHRGLERELTEEQQDEIRSWAKCTFQNEYSSQNNTLSILKEHRRTTTFLCISWFCIAFIFFGEMFIVPFMFQTESNGLQKYFWMTLGELPSLILTYSLIERESCGRRRSLISFFVLSALFCLYVVHQISSFSLFMAKLFMKACFQMLYPFSAESYPTSVRPIGFALNSVAGRIGSTIMPFIVYACYNRQKDSPFFIFAIISFIGAVSIWAVKNDTYQRALDETQQRIYSKRSSIESPTKTSELVSDRYDGEL